MSFDVVAFPELWPCTPVGGDIMKTVAEYRQFAEWCREMALKISDPKDKYAVELMAEAWDKVANDREAALERGSDPSSPLR